MTKKNLVFTAAITAIFATQMYAKQDSAQIYANQDSAATPPHYDRI